MFCGRWIAVAVVVGLSASAYAQQEPASSEAPPTAIAPHVSQPPTIDGVLDEPCWQQAYQVSGFYYTQGRRPATYDTTVRLCVDDRALYLGYYAHDDQPELIQATQTKRGGSLFRDDMVSVDIDPWGQRREGDIYTFRVNARGTQAEELPDVGSSNLAWRGDWQAAARVVEDGWVAEMRIPFAMLRYPPGQTSLGLIFWRRLQRRQEWSQWPPMWEQYDPRRMLTLTGLHLPTPRSRPLVMPYALLRAEPDSQRALFGLDAKHTLPNGLTAALAVNPDFANVEDVVETIAFSDTERELPETRPFLAEGSNFMPDRGLFFTRRLGETDWGAKAFGKVDRHRLGILALREANGSRNEVLNYGYDFNPDSALGVSLVQRKERDRNNLVAGIGGQHVRREGRGAWLVAGSYAQSRLTDAEAGLRYSVMAGKEGGEGRWSAIIGHEVVEPDYRPLAGFVPENDQRGWVLSTHTYNQVDRRLRAYFGEFSVFQAHRRDGSLLKRGAGGGFHSELKNGLTFSSSTFWQHRPPNRDLTVGGGIGWGHNSLRRRGEWNAEYGSRGGAHYFFTTLQQSYDPTEDLQLSVRWEYAYQNPFTNGMPSDTRTQTVFTANYDFDAYRSLSLRWVERKGKTSLFAAYRFAPVNGRNLFILFGDPNSITTRSRWQVKMAWPF